MTAKAEQETNIFDLTAHESVSLGLPHAVLLIKAFKAIAREELPARFDVHPSPTVFAVQTEVKWWLRQLKQAVFALEQNPHFFVRWFRLVMVNVGDYTCWRDTTRKMTPTPARKPMSDKKVQEGMQVYLDSERDVGLQGSQKRAWKWAQANMPGSRYRQVTKALEIGRGKRARGRPRTASHHQKSA